MKPHRIGDGEHTLAVFIDFENLALGFNNRRDRFNVEKILERLVEKGKIVVKRAYCDWSRFGTYTGPLHESAIELIEIPKRALSGKNSADIRLVVDAIDLAYSKDHIDTFVIVSGDSDFSPLVSKLKELGKHVIGLGLADATSNLLRDNCDEFIYYEDLDRAPTSMPPVDGQMPEAKRKMFALLMDSLIALRRESKDVIYSSMVKDTMKRKKPSFNEEYHGYRTFSELLEDAQKNGLLDIEKAKSSGTYVVTRFGTEPKATPKLDEKRPLPKIEEARPAPVPEVRAVVPPVERPPSPPRDREAPPRNREAPPRDREAPPRHREAPPRNREASPRDQEAPPRRAPVRKPRADAPPPRKPVEERAMLGRDLMEDIELLDEIPSYRPKPAKPMAAPKPAAPAKVADAPKPVKAAEPPKPVKAAEPPKPVKSAEPPKREAAPRRRTPEAAPKPKPRPPAGDEDSFGAGLDD